MRTDVRLIAIAMVVLFMAELALLAANCMLLSVFPFAGICVLCHHIERNREYYEREIDRICGKDDRLY